jgi:hypothetical protein
MRPFVESGGKGDFLRCPSLGGQRLQMWFHTIFSQPDVLMIIPGIKIITCALQIPRAAGFLRKRPRPT